MKKQVKHLVSLCQILSNGECHDSNTIGEAIGITEAAVEELIETLKTHGIPIEFTEENGYALLEPLYLLDEEQLKKGIKLPETKDGTSPLNRLDWHTFETIDSTHLFLKNLPHLDGAISICLAEMQVQGRGRFSRHWHSPFSENIYLSIRYPFYCDIRKLGGVSLLVAISLAITLENLGIPDIKINWPNDLGWHGKKLGGVLVEAMAETHDLSKAVIGIGLNVNMTDKKSKMERITQEWASLSEVLGVKLDRNQVLIALINQLLADLQEYAEKGLSSFLPLWRRYDALEGEQITLVCGEVEHHGKAMGVNENGHLLLKRPDGKIVLFSSGETSVKKKA